MTSTRLFAGLACAICLALCTSCSGDSFSGSSSGGSGGRDGGFGQPAQFEAMISADGDDGVWVNGTDERLFFSVDERTLEVGNDAEMSRAGLRFKLAIPAKSRIDSATIRLHRVAGAAPETDTIVVHVFEDSAFPELDDAHVHAPSEHSPGGLWPNVVLGFAVGTNGAEVESPDLKQLVQHIVDRPDWSEAGVIGFLLSPDKLDTWAAFSDSSSGTVSRLRVLYAPPK